MNVMAKIQTQLRLISVKESRKVVFDKMDFTWMDLVEDTSYYSEKSNKHYEGEREIRLNRNFIIEVYD